MHTNPDHSSTCVCRAVTNKPDVTAAIAELATAFTQETDFAFIMLVVAPSYDTDAVMRAIDRYWSDETVIGCTSAGEIVPAGYVNDHMLAIGFKADYFKAHIMPIMPLDSLSDARLGEELQKARRAFDGMTADDTHANDGKNCFALLLCDGLSLQEDRLVSFIGRVLGDIPLVGGSAGDDLNFQQTFVLCDSIFRQNAAVLALVQTSCRFKVFFSDHLVPTDCKMVITEADSDNRIVSEINAEPAAQEFARLLGKNPNSLTPPTFAAHPVTIIVGDKHYVRAIQRVEEDGSLRFFSAIDEGLVLTLADVSGMESHLHCLLEDLSIPERPSMILVFDCILRRLQVEHAQTIQRISDILSSYDVIGLSTYGEQYNRIHVNQTITGVAFYTALTEE